MFKFLVLVAFLATSINAGDVARQCIDVGELPKSFHVEGCSSAPCVVYQLEDAVFNIKFDAPRDSEALRTRLTVSLMSIITLPVDIGSAGQTCSDLVNTSCPVKEGQELEYNLKLFIEPFYPAGTSVAFEISVLDDANTPAFCARVPIIIAPPRNHKDQVQNLG